MALVEAIASIVEIWGQEQADRLRESIARKGNNANGDTFAASFVPHDSVITGNSLEWTMSGPSWYDVIDTGGKRWQKGKMPPVNSIMQWMAHKGIVATVKAKSKQNSLSHSIKKHKGAWQNNPKYAAQRSMAFAIAVNIKKHGVIKRFGGKGSNFYSEVFNDKAYADLNERIHKLLGEGNFLLTIIDPNTPD